MTNLQWLGVGMMALPFLLIWGLLIEAHGFWRSTLTIILGFVFLLLVLVGDYLRRTGGAA